jgi:hypothetical protein
MTLDSETKTRPGETPETRMSKRGTGANDAFWLWDGEAEYEGHLCSLDEGRLNARVRQIRRWSLASGAPGKPVLIDLMERQRLLTRRICFAQSPAIDLGALLEFRVHAVQRSQDRAFDFVLSGSFSPISDERMEALSQLSSDEAQLYLQSRRKGFPASGESAAGT